MGFSIVIMPHGINGSNDQKHSQIDETCGCTTEKNLVIMAGIGDYGKLRSVARVE